MARDQQRSIVFFPYLSMGSVTEIDFGFIKIWNYPLAGDTHLPDEKTRIHIKRVFSTYQSEGRAIEGMGIVAIGGVSDFSDLESEHLKRIKEVRLLLFLSFVARNNTLPLLGKAMQTRHGAAFWLLAYSGMRRGEVCSVKREHLDLEAGTLKVSSAVGRENSRLTVTPPKSKTSRRLIHLDSVTISVLRSHLARQAEHRLSVGPAYQDRGLVFASPTGDLLDPDILTRDWRRICKGVGVKYRLHDLRHAHVTALIEAGVHVKIIQSRVGHASPGFTLARYGHLMPGMDAAAAEAYARAMGD